jgi:hypothetical protein
VIREVGPVGMAFAPLEETETVVTIGGQLLLSLTSRDVQSVAELALASGQSATETVRSL